MSENYNMHIFKILNWNSQTFFWHLPLFRISLTFFQIPWQFPDLEKIFFPWLFPDVWQPWSRFTFACGTDFVRLASSLQSRNSTIIHQYFPVRMRRYISNFVKAKSVSIFKPRMPPIFNYVWWSTQEAASVPAADAIKVSYFDIRLDIWTRAWFVVLCIGQHLEHSIGHISRRANSVKILTIVL